MGVLDPSATGRVGGRRGVGGTTAAGTDLVVLSPAEGLGSEGRGVWGGDEGTGEGDGEGVDL